jgi:hypothetical protein
LIERCGTSNGAAVVELARELVRGLDIPIIEGGDEKGVTRFLTPNTTDLAFIPNEITRKRAELFSSVGLDLFNREARQMESAESKAFNQLDINSTLGNRARVLQEAEVRLIAASKLIDSAFQTYVPVWPDNFSVIDKLGDAQTLKALSDVAVTEEQKAKVAVLVDKTLDKQSV